MNKINIRYDNDKMITEEIIKLKKNPLFKNVDINKFNFNDFFIMARELKNCENCKSYQECKNKTKGYLYTCNLDEENYNFKSVMCRYKLNEMSELRGSSFIKTKHMPKGILDCSLDDFKLTTENRCDAYKYACRFINELKEGRFLRGLYLHGEFGVGKTYLMSAVANELGKNGIRSLLMYFPDLARELKSSMYNDNLEKLINELKTVPVLFIDDLGGELLTSWLRDDVIGPILNYRVAEKLPIFITSNLNLTELFAHLEQTKDEAYNRGKDSFKASRIIERIKNLVVYKEM